MAKSAATIKSVSRNAKVSNSNSSDLPKPIRLTKHAQEQCIERGTNATEISQAIREGTKEAAKKGRWRYRYNLEYNATWQNRDYAIKQVAPVIVEEADEIVVVTVYTFYF